MADKQAMQANGQESKGADRPDGVNDRAEDGQAGEGVPYPNGQLEDEEGGESGFFGHGGQSHLTDRSKTGEQADETGTD